MTNWTFLIKNRIISTLALVGCTFNAHIFCFASFQMILQRKDGLLDFYRNWADYKAGFGNFLSDYWIG